MRGSIGWNLALKVLLLGSTSGAFSIEPSHIGELLESKGYVHVPEQSGIREFSPKSYVLRAFVPVEGSRQGKSVIVYVSGDSVRPVDSPVWEGDWVDIDVLDVNRDGHSDLIVNEYYERTISVRAYIGDSANGFRKVLHAYSATKPKFLEFNLSNVDGSSKPIILTHDPYDLGGHVDLLVPHLYVFREGRYELVEKDCSPPK